MILMKLTYRNNTYSNAPKWVIVVVDIWIMRWLLQGEFQPNNSIPINLLNKMTKSVMRRALK